MARQGLKCSARAHLSGSKDTMPTLAPKGALIPRGVGEGRRACCRSRRPCR